MANNFGLIFSCQLEECTVVKQNNTEEKTYTLHENEVANCPAALIFADLASISARITTESFSWFFGGGSLFIHAQKRSLFGSLFWFNGQKKAGVADQDQLGTLMMTATWHELFQKNRLVDRRSYNYFSYVKMDCNFTCS